ncbi:uncharacterized protein LOC135942354 [Cloeon dipterum]|uniref:uncharacterized protein LOC135942354 n=1 Tax=Cloeon dipterum TaxID=197152 RepID=UPI0032201953
MYSEIIEDLEYAVERTNFSEECIDLLNFTTGTFYDALGNNEMGDRYAELLNDRYRKLAPEERQCFVIAQYLELIKCSRNLSDKRAAKIIGEFLAPPPLHYGQHVEHPIFSSALKIQEDPSDKILVAARDISIGDVLCVENPISYGMFMCTDIDWSSGGNAWLYCTECFKMCFCLRPCSKCSWINYCSDQCEKAAWDKYHKDECANMSKFMMTDECVSKNEKFFSQTFPFFFSSKVLAMVDYKADPSSASPEIKDLFDFRHKFDVSSDAYIALFKSPLVFNTLAMVSAGFSKSTACMEKFVNFLMDEALPKAYALLEECVTPVYFHDSGVISVEKRGWGIYKSSSFFEKACDGNVLSTFYQKTRVIRAVNPIKKGEKLTMRPNWRGFKWEERKMLKQIYSRKCECDNEPPYTENFIPKELMLDENLPLTDEFNKFLTDSLLTQGFSQSGLNEENFEMLIKVSELFVGRGQREYVALRELVGRFIEIYFHAQTTRFYPSTGMLDKTKCFYYVAPNNHLEDKTNLLTFNSVLLVKESLELMKKARN